VFTGVFCRYMQRAKLADLFIDTPLVNAHTSATDVLWAGVPLVTLPGAIRSIL
jgi:protein O-GlcNAc transferase